MNPTNKELAMEAIKGYNEEKAKLSMALGNEANWYKRRAISDRLQQIDSEIRELTLTVELE